MSKVIFKNSPETDLVILKELEKKVLWLSSWMIHHANHIRPNLDGLKVGGHQASSASLVTIMTALYFHALKAEDRVAVKPHASPVFHAIQYLLGNQDLEQLKMFRSFGGAQSYPSITKDKDDVDFSTGSVGMGVAATLFSAITQEYLYDHQWLNEQQSKGRMIALLGDAELDEGNIYEALLEGWKKQLKNTWWIVDYNRQSLDGVIHDELFQRIQDFFHSVGWSVITLKYGKKMQQAFEQPGGKALKQWVDECPNQLYSALTFKGGAAWRERLSIDLQENSNALSLLQKYSDDELHAVMTNLGGHDLELLIETFEKTQGSMPVCFIAYTIKGYGLPLAGHKDNHSGMMTPEQMKQLQIDNRIKEGDEWSLYAGLSTDETQLKKFLEAVHFKQRIKPNKEAVWETEALNTPASDSTSTQIAFGKLMQELSSRKDELADRVVTCSPDVASSTNLSAWLNKRGVYHTKDIRDTFRSEKVASPIKWEQSPQGQHIELGIAENNLFTLLASLGLSEKHFGKRLIPIGTLYDPFICRGLDALNYACYQDARFILAATPSGISLAPEGGAHQSINTPLIGMAQDNLIYFEPAFADELTEIFNWALHSIQKSDGKSVYLRLSTRAIPQLKRQLTNEQRESMIEGGYWLKEPKEGAELAIVFTGAVAPEAITAWEDILMDVPSAGLLSVTSSDRLHDQWLHYRKINRLQKSAIEKLLQPLSSRANIVTVCDSHPATLSWMGSVFGHRVESLGVSHFGQSGNIQDLYHHYHIDADAILNACARSFLR